MSNGSKWEREVAKYLSWWINGTEKPIVYWRSAGSGSVFTMSEGDAGREFSGDIYCIREEGKFLTDVITIECKSGYDSASLDKHLKYNKNDEIRDFWYQCTEDAVLSNKHAMLIFKKKGFSSPWLGIDGKLYSKLEDNLDNMRYIKLSWERGSDLRDVYFFGMHSFLEVITPSILKENVNCPATAPPITELRKKP